MWRFGRRRRQCGTCRKTWRVWKTKRGRKNLRVSTDLAHRFILHRVLPTRVGNRNKLQYRLARSRTLCAQRLPWPTVPAHGTLIAVADALVKYLEGTWQTWYFILVRRPEDNEAVILPPFYQAGTETLSGWYEAFERVDPSVEKRITALVCDGHRGLSSVAKWRGWKLQRCQFHLVSRIQSRRSKWKSSQHYEEGKRLYALVKRVFTEPDESALQPLINELEEIGWHTSSRGLKDTLKGFVTNYEEFRTYLRHPELRLPITNNTAETLNSLIEEVCSRARGFKSISVLEEWITCICKTRKTIRCAPKKSTN